MTATPATCSAKQVHMQSAFSCGLYNFYERVVPCALTIYDRSDFSDKICLWLQGTGRTVQYRDVPVEEAVVGQRAAKRTKL